MNIDNKRRKYHLSLIFIAFLMIGLVSVLAPNPLYAAGGDITISGPGLNNPDGITITQEQLQGEEPIYDDYCLAAWILFIAPLTPGLPRAGTGGKV